MHSTPPADRRPPLSLGLATLYRPPVMFMRARHDRISARLPAGERLYAIGDVHGEAPLLLRLLTAIDRDGRRRGPARTTLVLLGDIVDRGPHAADLLRTLSRTDDPRLIVLRGNHEQLMIDAWRGEAGALDLWLRVGGRATLRGFGIDDGRIDASDDEQLIVLLRASIDESLIGWLERLPTSWTAGDYFFAHAGVRPGVPLDRQEDNDLMWVRDRFLASGADHGKVVVHGHSIDPAEPRLGGNRIGLDTGAHEHRRLTALGLEDGRQWLLREADAAPTTVAAPEPSRFAALPEQLHRLLTGG